VLGSYPQSHPSVHDLLDAYYRDLQAAELHSSLHQSLAAAVKAGLKKARGKVMAFQKQLAAAEDAGAVQRTADMIMANVYRWAWGGCRRGGGEGDEGGHGLDEPVTSRWQGIPLPIGVCRYIGEQWLRRF
jgi:hypothetical protein